MTRYCFATGWQRIGQTVYFAQSESQDYDFVASWVADDVRHLATVQLKEVVPSALNPTTSLKAILDSLGKYVDSENLTVAIHLNQHRRFDPQDVIVPLLPIAGMWIFGSISEDQSEWGLWGNFMEQREGTRFTYPS